MHARDREQSADLNVPGEETGNKGASLQELGQQLGRGRTPCPIPGCVSASAAESAGWSSLGNGLNMQTIFDLYAKSLLKEKQEINVSCT